MKFILTALFVLVCFGAHATFTHIAVTGFNSDVVADGTGPVAGSVSAGFLTGFVGIDNEGHVLVAQDYADPNGAAPQYFLPTGGVVNSLLTPGLSFQLGDYTSKNALYLVNANDTGTLLFPVAQAAGIIYLSGTSAAGASSFNVAVNFSDGTNQIFTGNTFNDWYSATSASVSGIGSVGVGNGLEDASATSTAPQLSELQLTLSAANITKLVTGITITKTSAVGYGNLLIMGVTTVSACNAMPVAGAITASQTSGCAEYMPLLSLGVDYSTSGLAYQWLSSSDGITYTALPGIIGAYYLADITSNTYFRVAITCTGSNLTDTTAPLELLYTSPVATYATLPYFQGFENWIGTCFNYDRPDLNWLTTPSSGDASWRRDDQGADANWDSPSQGYYSPAFTEGAHSARFHSAILSSGSIGNMDLYVDLSNSGTKYIYFDYDNFDIFGGASLLVSISTDNINFTQLGQYGVSPSWKSVILATNITSPHAIIRFEGSITGGSGGEIGVDSVYVVSVPSCNGTPATDVISATKLSSCSTFTSTLSLNVDYSVGGLNYQWESSPDGVAYTPVTGATNNSYVATVANTTYYRTVITCIASNDSSITAPITLTHVIPVATYATLPYFQGFENWIGSCYNYDRPDASWLTSPSYNSNSWRRDDQGSDAGWDITFDAYLPAATQGLHSARFASSQDDYGPSGSMDLYVDLSSTGTKLITFDYINSDVEGTANMTVLISTDSVNFTQLAQYYPNSGWTQESLVTDITAHAILRFLSVVPTFTSGDMGIDSLNIVVLPTCAGAPVAGAVSSTQTSGCTVYTATLTVPVSASGIAYQWVSSADGVAFTNVAGATSFAYTTSVAANIYYRIYVTCTGTGLKDTSAATELVYTPEIVGTASLPYFQGFENWTGGNCYTDDRPDTNWIENPTSGDESWRRDDQGADAAWDNPDDGSYTPTATEGSHSARFHTTDAIDSGAIDLHIDLSATGTKLISFDYLNTDFNNSTLTVLVSTDGAQSFTQLAQYLPNSQWTNETITTTIAGNAILRFQGDMPSFSYGDMGIDSLSVSLLPACSGTPVAGTFSSTNSVGCVPYTTTLTVDNNLAIQLGGISYQWQSSADGVTYTDVAGATAVTYNASINASVYYRFYVVCAAGNDTGISIATELMLSPEVANIVTLPYFQGFENWTGTCYPNDRPDTNFINGPNTGLDAWRRDDQGVGSGWEFAYGNGTYSPAFTEGAHSARYHSTNAFGEGDLDLHVNFSAPDTKTITFDYYNDNGDDNLAIEISTDSGATFTTLATYYSGDVSGLTGWIPETLTTSIVSANAILRFAGRADVGNPTDIGLDSLYITNPPCDTVANVVVTNITQTGATVNWGLIGGTGGYDVTVDQSPANPAISGTSVVAPPYIATGLLSGTTYYAHVRDSCGPNSFSAWTTVAFTTIPTVPVFCDSITGLAVNSVTQTSANIIWNTVTGTAGYEVVVGTSAAIPATGAGVAMPPYVASLLSSNTVYYVFVRDSCDSNTFSAWDTLSFTTEPEGITNINGNNQFGVNAYPNPANDMITVSVYGLKGNNRKVSLVDVTGRTISTIDMATDKVNFNMGNLAAGIYLIRYEDDTYTRIIKINKQ